MHMSLKAGMTLVEITVVISIIALLSFLVAISLDAGRQRTRDTQRLTDLHNVEMALELYRNDNFGKVPSVNTNWQTTINGLNSGGNSYLPSGAPVDPGTLRTGQETYIYCTDSTNRFYMLIALLENKPDKDYLSGTLTTYKDDQCVHQDGLINNFAIYSANYICGQTLADGNFVYCLGKL